MVRELQCVGTVPRAVGRLDMYISKAILLVLLIAFVVVSGWAYWFVTAHGFSEQAFHQVHVAAVGNSHG